MSEVVASLREDPVRAEIAFVLAAAVAFADSAIADEENDTLNSLAEGLGIDEARANLAGHSATTLQVAGSVIAAVAWLLRHPNEGLRVPDELPYDELLTDIRRYIGTRWSGPVDWSPLEDRLELFPNAARPLPTDPWQFEAFEVRD